MRKSLHILALTLVLISVSAAAMAAESSAPTGTVNVNTADASQLALLPRIGEKAAQRIIEYRTEHGPFKKATDLMQVKGIGAKTFEGLSPYVAVDGKTTLSGKVRSRKAAAKKPTSSASN